MHIEVLRGKVPQYEGTKKPASIELLEYNKTDLERMLGNERRAREKQEQQQTKKHNRNGQGLE